MENNAINAPVSAFGKTLIDDANQVTAVATLLDNAPLIPATVAPLDLVIIQDSSNGNVARTCTAQDIADLSGGGAAPVDGTYITQVPSADLDNEQALSLLATGIMKSTTATGVVSIAAEGVDYYAPGGTDVAIADGGTGASTNTAGINNLVNNAALTATTVASGDLVLLQDISDSNNLKTVTAQSIADLGPGGSAAPQDGTYITQTPNASLTNEQALSLLSTGIMKSTTATGVVSIATSNVDYQAADATLISIAALGTAADKTIYTTGIDTWAETGLTAAGRSLIDDATAGDQRTTLGLGTIATQNSNSVTITGGSITGITDLAVADGGTGVGTFTPYAVICGGTTGTGQIQPIASVGASGQVLTSNGAGALPTFQAGGGGGGGTTTARVAMTAAQWNAMRLTPFQIVAPQGANTLIAPTELWLELAMAGVPFTSGGIFGLEYGSTAGFTGAIIVSSAASVVQTVTVPTFVFMQMYSNSGGQIFSFNRASSLCVNTGIYMSNQTFSFAGGTGAVIYVNITYSVLTTT